LSTPRRRRRRKATKVVLPITRDSLQWTLQKSLGDEGEEAVLALFRKKAWPYFRFKVPEAISKRHFADEQRVHFTSDFKKQAFLIDALAKIQGAPYAIEIKAKSFKKFVVDVNDYDPLYELSRVIPVRVYFYIHRTKRIYFHNVRDPRARPALNQETLREEPVYVIPSGELELVASN